MTDIAIIPIKTTLDKPEIYNKTDNANLMLFQRIIVLLLSNSSTGFRLLEGTQLTNFLSGGVNNTGVLQSLAVNSLAVVKSMLTEDLKSLLLSLTATVLDSLVYVTAVFVDGTTLSRGIS